MSDEILFTINMGDGEPSGEGEGPRHDPREMAKIVQSLSGIAGNVSSILSTARAIRAQLDRITLILDQGFKKVAMGGGGRGAAGSAAGAAAGAAAGSAVGARAGVAAGTEIVLARARDAMGRAIVPYSPRVPRGIALPKGRNDDAIDVEWWDTPGGGGGRGFGGGRGPRRLMPGGAWNPLARVNVPPPPRLPQIPLGLALGKIAGPLGIILTKAIGALFLGQAAFGRYHREMSSFSPVVAGNQALIDVNKTLTKMRIANDPVMQKMSGIYTPLRMQFDQTVEYLKAAGMIAVGGGIASMMLSPGVVLFNSLMNRLVGGGPSGVALLRQQGGNAAVNDAIFMQTLNNMTENLLNTQSSPAPAGPGKARIGYRNGRWERWRD